MQSMTYEQFERELYRCDGAVFDLDKTLVKGRVAEGVGQKFLLRELFRLHLGHFWLGVKNYGEVLKRAKEQGEVKGLEYFIGVIAQTGCATYGMFMQRVAEYIKKNSLPGSWEFVDYFRKQGMHTFVRTMGTDIAATEAARYFLFTDTIGNKVEYVQMPKGKIISRLNPSMRNGEEALQKTEEMLQRHRLSIERCFFIGNDKNDHDTMRAARLSAASPLADEATIEVANIHIPDYRTFLEELKAT